MRKSTRHRRSRANSLCALCAVSGQSKAACAWFNENFPNIELVGAERIWMHDGKLHSKADRDKPPLRRITTKNTTAGHVWITNSPDLNVAELAVAAIADKTKLGMGSYSQKELNKIAKKRWADYDQAASMMPSWACRGDM